jgi:dephospho-CoA kinase
VPYVVGLTGGIGSGKSEVAGAFAGLGIEIADSDAIAHQLSMPGEAGHAAIVGAFGEDVLLPTGGIDRAKLRRRVFTDAAQRARLEALLHPLIREEALRQIALWRGPYGIVVVPLLLERGGVARIVDRILVVDCAEEEQVRRVIARSAMSPAEVRAIMATQLARSRRLAAADDVLDNSGPRERIGPQVQDLDRRYRQLALNAVQSR